MKPPCIRGLKQFDKKGCPCKTWDGEEGCPAWVEMPVVDNDNPQKQSFERMCVDLWIFKVLWHSNGLLEGNQKATESFRNGMCEVDPNTKEVRPKMDIGTIAMLKFMANQQKLVK